MWPRLLTLVLLAFWESGGSAPVAPSISDFTLWPLKPGRRPPEPQEAPSGSPGWHLLPQSAEGSAQARGWVRDPALDSRSPSASLQSWWKRLATRCSSVLSRIFQTSAPHLGVSAVKRGGDVL